MPLVAAKCESCGANLEVNPAQDSAICNFCGTQFIVEKAVSLYNTTNNITASTVNVYGNADGVDNLYKRATDWLTLKNETKAVEVFMEMVEQYPSDVRGWSMLAQLCPTREYIDNAIRLGDSSFIAEWETNAQVICAEIRNGSADPNRLWTVLDKGALIIIHQLSVRPNADFPCVRMLLDEGQETAEILKSKWGKTIAHTSNREIANAVIKSNNTILSKYWGCANFNSLHIGNIIFVIGRYILSRDSHNNLNLCICDKILSKTVIVQTFDEIEVRRRNRLCAKCGGKPSYWSGMCKNCGYKCKGFGYN
ncbi:MAG: hypothetical protein FWE06_04115 [Oscillospiraceae bacterium]|nr:hypothetical protein [Oscillospiraceae bacterium]